MRVTRAFLFSLIVTLLVSTTAFAVQNTDASSYAKERANRIRSSVENYQPSTSQQQQIDKTKKDGLVRYVVKFNSEASIEKRQLLDDLGCVQIGPDGANLFVVKGEDALDKIKNAYGQDILSIETDKVKKKNMIPNDALYGEQWYLNKINMEDAWQITTGSTNVKVAVIDSGVDPTHPDLQGILLNGYNFYDGNTSVYDSDGHGTMNVGIIAANSNNQKGITGINWKVKILPLHVSGPDGLAYMSDEIDAIYWAVDAGAKVINISMGGDESDQAEKAAIDYAVAHNVVVVASAGNDGTSAPCYPAAYAGVISVGATNKADARSSFSQYNNTIDVVAPGEDIVSTYDKTYASGDGTSFSAPQVSGVAALMLAVNPALSRTQIETIIESTSTDKGTPGRDNEYGFGLLNAYEAVKHCLPAKGDLNGPAANETVNGTIPVWGWFVDGSGVNKIEIMVDGKTVGLATLGLARADVLAAFPAYADGNSGYEYRLDTKTLSNGAHKVMVRETSNNGIQTSLPARTIAVSNAAIMPAKGDLNNPTASSTISGTVSVSGWFVDGDGVAKIEVLVDGSVKGVATKGLARPDVLAAFPQYNDGNSGYEYALDTKALTNGSHKIVIRETSGKGVQTSLAARTVTVNNVTLPAKGDLNGPAANQTVSGTIPVWGWFLDGNGVSKIEVLVDGKVKGTATKGLARPDVQAAFPAYADGNSGYEYALDTWTLTNGNHTIVVRETSNKGVATSLPARTIKVSNLAVLPAKGDINGPTANQTVNGTIPVWGWFVDGNGVNKIEVLVDSKIVGTATKGLARPDVLSAFPSYADGNSGYDYRLDTTKLSNGTHTIVVRETSNKGAVTSLPARTITVSNVAVLPPKGDLNGPTANQTVSGTIPVWGWFVDGNGVSKVEVLVDGAVYADATIGLSRPDVLAAFPEYQNGNSGFDYWLDTTKLTNGVHQITVREVSQTGAKATLTASTVTINNP